MMSAVEKESLHKLQIRTVRITSHIKHVSNINNNYSKYQSSEVVKLVTRYKNTLHIADNTNEARRGREGELIKQDWFHE
jgi:hypothetical protein